MSSSRLSCRLLPSVVLRYSWYAMLRSGGRDALLLSHGSGRPLRPRSHQKTPRGSAPGKHSAASLRRTGPGAATATATGSPPGPPRPPHGPGLTRPSGRSSSGAARKRKAEGGARRRGWGGEGKGEVAEGAEAGKRHRDVGWKGNGGT